jgi:hypothetical protein
MSVGDFVRSSVKPAMRPGTKRVTPGPNFRFVRADIAAPPRDILFLQEFAVHREPAVGDYQFMIYDFRFPI